MRLDLSGQGNKEYHSFLSGHTILAMTNTHAIAKQFKTLG